MFFPGAQGPIGAVEVICGSMFSGKTEELLRRLKRAQIARQKVQAFKHSLDQRYSATHVQSHDGFKLVSVTAQAPFEILERVDPNTRVVGIDEAQFFSNEIIDVVQKLAYRGARVIVAGLDLDFRAQPFGPMPGLLATAEFVTKLFAVCVVCGAPASRSQRVITDVAQAGTSSAEESVLVGARETYEARCRFCHEPTVITRNPSRE